MKIKKLLFTIILLGGFFWSTFSGVKNVLAVESVNLNVQVLQRKSTDTINDFVFDGTVPTENPPKEILGASTTNLPQKDTFWHKLLLWIKYPFLQSARLVDTIKRN